MELKITEMPKASNSSTTASKPKTKQQATKDGEWIVGTSSNDKTIYAIAKKFNMSISDFKNMTGLTKDTLQPGQVIKGVPHAIIPPGKGLSYLAQQYGMTVDQLRTLNDLPKNYTPKANEEFYVYKTYAKDKSLVDKTENAKQVTSENKPTMPQRQTVYTVKSGDNLTTIAKKYNMTIAEFKQWTGLQKDSLQTGQKINLPTASVPKGKGIRTLAKKHNMDFNRFCEINNIPEPRDKYVAKNNEQFYVVKGLKANGATPSSSNTSIVSNGTYTVPTCGYISVPANETHNVRVISGGAPIPVNQNGKVVAEVIRFEPLKKNTGELKGKTIMVNAGHGWKTSSSTGKALFHPGALYKDENGKQLEEWRKNRDFAEELIKDLRAKGATVIYTTGGDVPVNNAKKKYKHDLLISLHCNALKNNTETQGLRIFVAESEFKNGASKDFANITAKKLNLQSSDIKKDIDSQHDGIGLIRDTASSFYAPAILLEMGFMSNSDDLRNIDSIKYRQESMDLVADAIVLMAAKNKQKNK